MEEECLKCGTETGKLHSICDDCAQSLFSENIFWIASSPVIGPPVTDRYKKDSEPILRIGDIPDDEVVFKEGEKTVDELKNIDVEDMEPEDYESIQGRMDTIMTELGITEEYEPDNYLFSKETVQVFSEIFYTLEEIEHKFKKRKGLPSLYMRLANLFYYTMERADIPAFSPDMRKKITDDLFKEAEGYYQMAIDITEDYLLPYLNRGHLLLEKGEYSSARDQFENALDIEEDLRVRKKLIESLIGLDELDRAEELVNELNKRSKEDAELWFLKGEVAREDDRWGGALQFYNQAMKFGMDSSQLYERKCDILSEREMYTQLNDLCDDYIDEDESNPTIWFFKADSLMEMDQWGGALQCVNDALSIDPQMAEAWNLRGKILKERGDFEEAIDNLDNALKLDPGLKEAEGNKDEAKKMMSRS